VQRRGVLRGCLRISRARSRGDLRARPDPSGRTRGRRISATRLVAGGRQRLSVSTTHLNATPTLLADRHLTSHRRNERNQSRLNSRKGGIPCALATSRQAPPAERSRTVQPIILRRSGAMSWAALKTWVRTLRRRSCIEISYRTAVTTFLDLSPNFRGGERRSINHDGHLGRSNHSEDGRWSVFRTGSSANSVHRRPAGHHQLPMYLGNR